MTSSRMSPVEGPIPTEFVAKALRREYMFPLTIEDNPPKVLDATGNVVARFWTFEDRLAWVNAVNKEMKAILETRKLTKALGLSK